MERAKNYIEKAGKIFMANDTLDAFTQAQAAFAGEAQRLGLESEQDVIDLLAEIRRERRE